MFAFGFWSNASIAAEKIMPSADEQQAFQEKLEELKSRPDLLEPNGNDRVLNTIRNYLVKWRKDGVEVSINPEGLDNKALIEELKKATSASKDPKNGQESEPTLKTTSVRKVLEVCTILMQIYCGANSPERFPIYRPGANPVSDGRRVQ